MARALEAGANRMQVAPRPRKKPEAPEAGQNPVQVAPTRNPLRQAPEAEPKLPPRVAEAGRNSAGGAIRSIREPFNPLSLIDTGRRLFAGSFPGGRGPYDPRSYLSRPPSIVSPGETWSFGPDNVSSRWIFTQPPCPRRAPAKPENMVPPPLNPLPTLD